MKLTKLLSALTLVFLSLGTIAQNYWQQAISYEMDVTLNTKNHQVTGTQKIAYTNNSPDVLNQVFFHLYFNAFQPGSMMDVRSRTIEDPDGRVGDRIGSLTPDEIGFQKIISLKQGGQPVKYSVKGTILQVTLNQSIAPGSTAIFEVEFLSQVPVQIRRSGRDNKEGIDYSMTQWYPKLCEYDEDGWHANPYVGREFYGVWGDFAVNITAPKNLIIGGTGAIIAEELNGDMKTWSFKAENVHDFAWAADPDYIHDAIEGPNGMTIHFYYQNDSEIKDNWKKVQQPTVELFEIMNANFGVYPYKQYSILQGGDGGMEYPQATLITGNRSYGSLLGVIVHEVNHSWYQMILGTNESLYPWMDEGFTTFASSIVMDKLLGKNEANPHTSSIGSYLRLVSAGKQEPLATHADFFHTNFAYGVSSYSKGETFLWQLQYMLGDEVFFNTMKGYYNTWKFKHPDANNFIKIAEDNCNCILDWYKEGWINTTNEIDYAVKSITADGKKTSISLEKIGGMAMPLDVKVTLKSGKELWFHIPNYNAFQQEGFKRRFKHPELKVLESASTLNAWPWTHPEYIFSIDVKEEEVKSVSIDPFMGTADTERSNNTLESGQAPVSFKGN